MVSAGNRNTVTARQGVCSARFNDINSRIKKGCRDAGGTAAPEGGYFAAFICLTTSSMPMEPAGKALLMTWVKTSLGLPCITWIGIPK